MTKNAEKLLGVNQGEIILSPGFVEEAIVTEDQWKL